jgi:uncharacterized protein YegL
MKNHDPDASTLQAISRFIQGSDENTRVAILSFNEYVSVISPLTHLDLETINELKQRLDTLKPESLLSNTAAAVERSIYELETHARADANKVIILLTDTYIHTVDPSDDYKFEKWLREILASDAIETDIQVFGIAIGEDADIQSLQILAEKTGGQYYQAKATHEIQTALDKIHHDLFSGGQKLAQSPNFLSVPQQNPVETPPLQMTTQSEMNTEETWQSPLTVGQEIQAPQPRPIDIDRARSNPAQRLETKAEDPKSSPAIKTADDLTHAAWATKSSIQLLISASIVGLAGLIGTIWLLRYRKRRILNIQNKQTTQSKFTPAAEIHNEEIPSSNVIRSGDIAVRIDTDDKTSIRSSNDQSLL